jgi:Family of unknown function (DUF5317)
MLWVLLLPYALTGVGAASNQLVLIANHDKFPVMMNEAARAHFEPDANGLIDKEHCVMTDKTHFNALADIFDLHDGWYSIGDFMLMLADWLSGFCVYVWIALVVKSLYQRRRYDG